MKIIKRKLVNKTKKLLIFCIPYLMLFAPAQAQTVETLSENTDVKDTEKDKAPKYNLYVEAGFEYDDNVYRLSGSQESLYEESNPGDKTSGRFKDMDSLSDYIIEPLVGIKFKSKSPFGGQFRLSSRLKYNYYIKNEKSGYPEGRIKLEQPVLKDGDLSLEANFLYGFFKKNYLSGAEDPEEANINRSERIYSPAVYDEYEGILDYKHKVIKKSDMLFLTGLSIQPFIGYRYRVFNSTFDNRNQNLLLGGLGLNLEFISRINMKSAYSYEMILCPGNEEFILFDENNYGADVNGDGDSDNNNAPLFTKIDRSCSRHTIEIKPSFELTEHWELSLGLKLRKTIYTTDNRLDIDRYNQKKDYWQVKAGMKYEFLKDLSGQIEWIHTAEDDSDDGKSSQNRFIAAVKFDFI